jgi:TetR/AcrR family transcriptional regulator, acrAB operon repressor
MRRTKEQADATRAHLRDSALEVFAERGYATARLEEIAERAGVTRGALYHHYADKAELYAAVVGELWWEVVGPILGLLESEDPPFERLERFLVAYIRAIDGNPRFRALLTLSVLKTEALPELAPGLEEKERAITGWLEQLRGAFSEARRRGELAEGVQPGHAARAFLCFVNGITTTVTVSPGVVNPSRDAGPLARALIGGLRR